MTSPADEISEPTYRRNNNSANNDDRSSENDGTVVGESYLRNDVSQDRSKLGGSNLNLNVSNLQVPTEDRSSMRSPSQSREEAHRLDDELRMLQIERQVSARQDGSQRDPSASRSVKRERSRRDDPVDDFDVATNPLHERTQIYKPPENPKGATARFFKRVHNSNIFIRWFTYIVPPALIIAIPLVLGLVLGNVNNVGGVQLGWFCVWLEICWLTLWAGRFIAKILPWPIGVVASLFTNNSKKWRDMGKQLELAATLFFWWLGIEVSFLPTMRNHDTDPNRTEPRPWQGTMNKVLVSFFVAAILNFVEKIIIQLIAISFHLRTYQDRIEINKFQIGSLTKLYEYSKAILSMDDSDFEERPVSGGANDGAGSGARTPGMIIEKAQKNTKKAFARFGDVTGKIAGDFTGRKVVRSNHPSQVILSLLSSPTSSQVLARRLYRTFARDDNLIHQEDLKNAFETEEEADAAFSMFDKDLNGDISMEELEAVCVEIGRERKSITASLKDLDSVVSKLDNVFTFIVIVISILVFISLISTSAAGVLTSAGSTILALSWLFSTTAQEFLQSVIFVFVKHPFDVGDRVTIYGNTGKELTGDDYFVKEIALLYTEFKKMEGHVVQAPNSYLNELFILNQRRSGGLAEAVPIIFKFGTSVQQIEDLRAKLLEFVTAEKREYQPKILSELREITEAYSITLHIIFFFKSNWQNELVRLQRRNKFICALMQAMHECGIQGPRMLEAGYGKGNPLYLRGSAFAGAQDFGAGGPSDGFNGASSNREDNLAPIQEDEYEGEYQGRRERSTSDASATRRRGESLSQMGRRVDWSLGMNDVAGSYDPGDIGDDREKKLYERIEKINKLDEERKEASRSRARSTSIDQSRGFSTARQQSFNMHRSRTDIGGHTSLNRERGSIMSVHRNRFFGRKSLERDAEGGMAGIPESSSRPPQIPPPTRMDPRSGMISEAAVRRSSEVSRSAFPRLSTDRSPRRAYVEEIDEKPEMKQL